MRANSSALREAPPTSPPLLEWVETVWNKQCVEKDTVVHLADQDYTRKGIPAGEVQDIP